MRVCGVCRQVPYINDPMGEVFIPFYIGETQPGNYIACSRCLAEFNPSRPVKALVNPLPPPSGWGEFFCGICRCYSRENDSMGHVRLAYADLDDGSSIQPGSYKCCSECLEKYRPRIHARLMRAHEVLGYTDCQGHHHPKPPPKDSSGGEWLL